MHTTQNSRSLRVLFVISQDSGGGAARAVHRIYVAIRDHMRKTVSIKMRVIHKTFDDHDIIGGKPTRSRAEYVEYFIRTRFRKYFPRKPFISDNKLLHSQALYHSGLGRELNAAKTDVIMLGWLGNSTLSIPEIGRIKHPVVWRLSDMWMFSGAEHYTPHPRYVSGYSRKSRPPTESGPDIDRETFKRKLRHWKTPRHIIVPSQWMADQARRSQLTRNWPIHVIPNPISTQDWFPEDKTRSRQRFGIPNNATLVLFGVSGSASQHHKGGDLLLDALPLAKRLQETHFPERPLVLGVFGDELGATSFDQAETRFLGRLNDEELRFAYSAADVMVVPSRLDNWPSTAVEAQACGTPVVAFRVAGLPDIVEDGVTGQIVEPFDTEALAEAIAWCVSDTARLDSLSEAARVRAQALWSPEIVARQYVEVLSLAAGKTH